MLPFRYEAGWRGWVWVCVVGIAAGLLFAQAAVLLAAAGLGVVVFSALSWHSPRAARFRGARRVEPEVVFSGEKASVCLEIRNGTLFPYFWCRLLEPRMRGLEPGSQVARTVTLWPRGNSVTSYEVLCRRKGVYRWEPVKLELRDPLGFHARLVDCPAGGTLTVFPRVYPVAVPGLCPVEPYGRHRSLDRSVENPASPTGVRDYAPGDPPGRIHWKLTAHTGGLKTREFDLTGCGTVELVCDLDAVWYDEDGEVMESVCSVAASIAYAALAAGDSVGLHLLGREEAHLMARSGIGHLEAILGHLAACEAERGAGLGAAVLKMQRVAPRSMVFVVSPAPAKMLVEPVAVLRGRGHPVWVARAAGPRKPGTKGVEEADDVEGMQLLASLGAKVYQAELESGEVRLREEVAAA